MFNFITLTSMMLAVILAFVLALVLAVIVVACVLFGIGYLLSLLLPLSIFQCTMLVVGSSFILIFGIAAAFISSQISHYGQLLYNLQEFDEDDDDEEDEEEENHVHPKVFLPRIVSKIGRNALCPCGSGKKHKYCCGR